VQWIWNHRLPLLVIVALFVLMVLFASLELIGLFIVCLDCEPGKFEFPHVGLGIIQAPLSKEKSLYSCRKG
jgi:hypothetical protein